jgi:hypothetical protein
MRISRVAIVLVTSSIVSALPLFQVQIDSQLITTLLQIPMVAGLIYLVLALEDKRQASATLREETFRKVVNDLLGVIAELSTLANPNTITSTQIKSIEQYLKSQKEQV